LKQETPTQWDSHAMRPEGLEPTTPGLKVRSSDRLSYGRKAKLAGRAQLVPEVAPAGEHHCDAGSVAGLDHLGVSHRAAGLDDRPHARLDPDLGAIGEREEGVGGERRALERAV